jgi:hypothetical protein
MPLDIIEEEEDQSLDETELIDQDGQFIIFSPAEELEKDQVTEQSNAILSTEEPAAEKKEP